MGFFLVSDWTERPVGRVAWWELGVFKLCQAPAPWWQQSVPAMDFAGKRHRECWSEAHPKDHLVFLFAQSSPLQNERFLQLLFKSNETSMEFPSSLECFIILHHRLFLLMSLATKTCNCSGKQWCGGSKSLLSSLEFYMLRDSLCYFTISLYQK